MKEMCFLLLNQCTEIGLVVKSDIQAEREMCLLYVHLQDGL
jgi:hypothetical protein